MTLYTTVSPELGLIYTRQRTKQRADCKIRQSQVMEEEGPGRSKGIVSVMSWQDARWKAGRGNA